MPATVTTVERQKFLTADAAFTLAEEFSKLGQDTDVLCCRIGPLIFGYRVQPAAPIPPVGWELVARMFGVGTEAGPALMKMIGGTA